MLPLREYLPETVAAAVATQSDATLTAATAAVVAVLVASSLLLLRKSPAKQLTGEGSKPLRKIHELPSTLPVLGNLLDITKRAQDRHDWFEELSREYDGEPFVVKIPGMPDLVVVSTPELIEEITATQFDVFVKGAFQQQTIEDLLGRGMVSSDGERWYHQRKAAVKFFTARALRAFMTHSMKNNMDEVYGVLDAGRASGELVNLHTLFHEFTLQTFVEMGVGVNVQCIGSKDPHPFERAADISPPVVTRRARVPPFVWKLERLLKIGPEGELIKAKAIVYDWVGELVQQSLANLAAKKQQQSGDTPAKEGDESEIKSVVELFAESSHEDTDGLRSEDLVDFLLTFVLAARDTTALSLSWLFYALAKHPHVEKAIRAEMAMRLGPLYGDQKAYLTTDHVRTLTYLEATLKETLRLYTVVPFTRRQAAKDTIIGGEYLIRKGQCVGLSAYLLARNPKVWGPDAAEFKPERWIDATTGEIVQAPTSKFFAFSSGPRTCIGMNLAMMELRVVSANLINKYRFEVDLEVNDGKYLAAPSLAMKHHLDARVKLNAPTAA